MFKLSIRRKNMTKMVYPVLVGLLLGINGCDSSSDSNNTSTTSSSVVQETVASSSSQSVSSTVSSAISSSSSSSDGDVSSMSDRNVVDKNALVRANTLFNNDLYQELKSEGENLFYSPFSVFSALSMNYAGARNATKREFETVLHYDENLSVHESFAALLEQGAPEYNVLNIANSLWPQEGYSFKDSFIDTVEHAYDTNVMYQNYLDNPEVARVNINAWVEAQTQNKIVDLIPSLTEDTRLVLVNAIYFKGTWEVSFDKNDTDIQPFYLSDGTQENVEMMHLGAHRFSYYENADFQMLVLPYKENEFSMLIFLPKELAKLSETESILQKSSPMTAYTHLKQVIVSLPKFTIKWGTFNLTDALKKQGMINTFDRYAADFGDMYDAQESLENVYISDIYHQAFIEVNEEGAEAAAATAVVDVGVSGGIPSGPTVFNADHPFIFYIIDNRSQMILFSGKLERP